MVVPIINAISVFLRSTRYFGICQFLLRYCCIGYSPPKCPPPRGALTKCQCVWLRRTLRCPSCLQVGITVGMIPPSCILFGINYCTRENDPPPPLAPPSPPLTSQIYARLGPAVGGDGWGASAITGQHSQQLTLLCNSVICYEY